MGIQCTTELPITYTPTSEWLFSTVVSLQTGAQLGAASVSPDDIGAGTGFGDPASPNAGNTW